MKFTKSLKERLLLPMAAQKSGYKSPDVVHCKSEQILSIDMRVRERERERKRERERERERVRERQVYLFCVFVQLLVICGTVVVQRGTVGVQK